MRIIGIITGLIIGGEAIALLIGMYFFSEKPNYWLNMKNLALLITDIISGIFLVFYFLKGVNDLKLVVYFFIGIILLSHGLRTYEYWVGTNNTFCFNVPLFIVNNIKLLLSVVLLIIFALR